MPEIPEMQDREQVIRGEAVAVVVAALIQGFKLAPVAALLGSAKKAAAVAVEADVRAGLLPERGVVTLTPAAH
jgi:hypothetical protein